MNDAAHVLKICDHLLSQICNYNMKENQRRKKETKEEIGKLVKGWVGGPVGELLGSSRLVDDFNWNFQ